MRNIEFKGWCERDSEWRHGYYVSDGNLHEILTMTEGGLYSSRVDPESIGQFTGLKDTNGKDIYEGDIVKCRYSFGTQETLNRQSQRFIGKVSSDIFKSCTLIEGVKQYSSREAMLHRAFLVEVIGNIYENPELLEE